MGMDARRFVIEAFCILNQNMDMQKITVKEIIGKAGVNRSTFYYYFKDKNDLIRQLQEKKFEEFFCTLQVKPDYKLHFSKSNASEAFPGVFAACEHIRGNMDLYKVWFKDEEFNTRFSELLASYLENFSKNSIYCTYIAYGTIGYFKKWIGSGCLGESKDITMGILHMSSQSFTISNL